jgi:CBS-domain-containing membrane protein
MKGFVKKLQGGAELPARAEMRHVALSWLGGFLAIAFVAYLAQATHMPLVLGSFGASCVLVFGFPESPFSQPRNVILGHFLSSLIGLIFLALFGTVWWSMALALATAIGVMQVTRTVHPPAGSNPLIVMMTSPQWSFLLFPTLIGAVMLVAVAVIFNNLPPERSYPKYWLG